MGNKRRKLNKSRSFAKVVPPLNTAVAYQDGVYFNGQGLEVFTNNENSDMLQKKSVSKWNSLVPRIAQAEAEATPPVTSEETPSGEDTPVTSTDQTGPDPEGSTANETAGTETEGAADDQTSSEGSQDADEGANDTSKPGNGAVDLVAWAKGEKHPWFTVRAAFREQLSTNVKNKEDAIDKLIQKGLITAGEVKA